MKRFHENISQPSEFGESFPLGSTIFPGGVNFSLFCKNGTSVELLFFDHVDDVQPSRIITLDAKQIAPITTGIHLFNIFQKGSYMHIAFTDPLSHGMVIVLMLHKFYLIHTPM